MGFTESTKRPGDESYRGVDINDFSLGLLSDIDALDIPINGSPNCENVKPRQGSCDGQADGDGFAQWSPEPLRSLMDLQHLSIRLALGTLFAGMVATYTASPPLAWLQQWGVLSMLPATE